MRLEEIADINIGVLINREIREDGNYLYNIFKLKNNDEVEEKNQIRTYKNLDEKLTKQGDILFRLVSPNKVIYIDKKTEGLLVPSQMCIIRPNKGIIDPIFLKWYLESDLCSEQILINTTGSSIQKISVNSIRKIEIPEIPLEKQSKIKDLIKLSEKEKQVIQMIIERKEKLYTSIIEEIIEEG